jgi:hypothetical protein
VVLLKPLLDVFGRVLFTPRLLVFLKSETDRGRLYVFGYMVPVKVMPHVKKNKGLPRTLLPPLFFEYTLGVDNRVELFRFDQIRKGVSFFWIRRDLRFRSRDYQHE